MRSSARYTSPMPPRPRSATRRYRPATIDPGAKRHGPGVGVTVVVAEDGATVTSWSEPDGTGTAKDSTGGARHDTQALGHRGRRRPGKRRWSHRARQSPGEPGGHGGDTGGPQDRHEERRAGHSQRERERGKR